MSDKIDRFKQKAKRRPSPIEETLDAYMESAEIEEVTNVNDNVNVDVNVNVIYDDPRPTKRKKFEQAYTRQTYYIENTLLKQLNKLAGREKGEKTRIINEALERYLNK